MVHMTQPVQSALFAIVGKRSLTKTASPDNEKDIGSYSRRFNGKLHGVLRHGRSARATPSQVHSLAKELGIPNNKSAKGLMGVSKKVTGKEHLDDMTSTELKSVASALSGVVARRSKTKTAAEEAPEHGTGIEAMKEWFKPYPHQEASINKLLENKGKLILAHQTGTGKTVTSIYGFEKMRKLDRAKRALVIVPSGLRENFAKNGIGKFTNSTLQVIGSEDEVRKKKGYIRPGQEGPADYTVVSYATFRRDPEGIVRRSGADTIIADEFHKIRNEKTSVFQGLMRVRPLVRNFMGLTASLINNKPEEIASLLAVSEGVRGMTPTQFKHAFTQTVGYEPGYSGKPTKKVISPKNEKQLAKVTAKRIDYRTTGDLVGKTMPRKDVKNVDVEMSKEQYKLYQLALKKLGPLEEYITRRDKNVTVKDAQQLFTQIAEARRLSNSVGAGRSDVSKAQSVPRTPKLKKILGDTREHLDADPNHKVVLYSNLIRGGVDALSAGLREMGVDHSLFVGKGKKIGERKVTGVTRQDGVQQFKAGKRRVIVLSGAGAEGLDLKNATAFYALDGHFNPEKIQQAEARARRLGGQKFREPDKRVVDVRRYRSVAPKPKNFISKMFSGKPKRTVDEWMYNTAGRKFKANAKFKEIIHKPNKYVRKYKDPKTGETRYVYPEDLQVKTKGFFGRLFS